MDDATAHARMWHEDDELHQAEGMLCVRLGVSLDEAVRTLRAHAEAEGMSSHDLARRVIAGTVTITP